MAEAALKEEMMPEGGIADFIVSDEELSAMDEADAKKEFGESGIAEFKDVASRMASYGRYGDDKLVHAETGELVVPKALIQDNPELKESIFSHLREMGIEDPERYVVGSDANSINPETGLPEFFLKKIFKGVKKAFKSVGKLLKKAAPIILPIALGMTPLGPVYGAALGSGIGTLVNGGSMKDAFKSALIAGGTGALFAGFTGGGSFGENVSAAFSSPMDRLSQLGAGVTGKGPLFSGYTPADATAVAEGAKISGPEVQTFNTTQVTEQAVTPYKPSGFVESIQKGDFSEAFFPSGPTTAQVAQAQGQAYTEAYNAALSTGATPEAAKAAGQAAIKNVTASSMSPGLMRTYGPLAAAGTVGLTAAGFFDAPEQPPEEEMVTGAQLLAQDPDKYAPKGYQLTQAQPSGGAYSVPTAYTYSPINNPLSNPFEMQYAAQGGEIFPRRVGGIMPDEGIPGKDSVRAMLMPGEFVMTTDAVKGLGNGDMGTGIKNMYQMMRSLESKGKAFA